MKHAERVEILVGDVLAKLREMPDESVDCVVTSPPYWGLRDYGVAGQIGLEPTLGEHLEAMVAVLRDIRRVLKPTGVCWLNYGDCYAAAPNGRSAADTKAIAEDDRTFRDKPFSTVGAVYASNHGKRNGVSRGEFTSSDRSSRVDHGGRVVAVRSPAYDPGGGASGGGRRGANKGNAEGTVEGRVVAGGYLKPKDLCMVPQRLFIALQDDGWWVRSVMPWVKRNGMPESIRDRPANSLEYVAMLTKSERYWYDAEAVRVKASPDTNARISRNVTAAGSARANGGSRADRPMKAVGRAPGVTPKSAEHISGTGPGRNRANESWHAATAGDVISDRNFRNTDLFYSSIEEPWGLISDANGIPIAIDANPAGFSEAHFATFPPALIEPLIKAGCPVDGVVLDPFGGAGTTGLVAAGLGRRAILIELNPEYAQLARARIEATFMGKEEGQRHMVKKLGKLELDAGPLFGTIA